MSENQLNTTESNDYDNQFNTGIKMIINAYDNNNQILSLEVNRLNETIQEKNKKITELEELCSKLLNEKKTYENKLNSIIKKNDKLKNQLETISKENTDLKKIKQTIIETIDTNKINKTIEVFNNNINNNSNLNQNDEQGMFRFFLETFKENNRSVISDIFFGIIETITECLNCKQINLIKGIFNTSYVYNFQIINFIIFPLEEIRKMKSEINNFYFNEVNLYDCFDYYERPEIMQGDNQMWCKNCRQNSPANYMTRIYSPPIYFILILNRGKGNIYNIKLNFEEFIDIGKYVQMKQNKNLVYQLYAIVTHLGPSSMSGHFIAFCKSPIDNKWYKYNDSQVSLIGNFSNDIHEFGCPYILFYEGQGL